jgi:hypothetical protein
LKDADEKMQEELFNRDRYIDALNQRLLELRTAKHEAKAKALQEKDEALETLTSEKTKLEQELDQLREQMLDRDSEL